MKSTENGVIVVTCDWCGEKNPTHHIASVSKDIDVCNKCLTTRGIKIPAPVEQRDHIRLQQEEAAAREGNIPLGVWRKNKQQRNPPVTKPWAAERRLSKR